MAGRSRKSLGPDEVEWVIVRAPQIGIDGREVDLVSLRPAEVSDDVAAGSSGPRVARPREDKVVSTESACEDVLSEAVPASAARQVVCARASEN